MELAKCGPGRGWLKRTVDLWTRLLVGKRGPWTFATAWVVAGPRNFVGQDRLLAGGAVDQLTHDVGMTVVAGCLLYQV